ncbi:MAG: flagellar protein FlaG [Deferribacteraceae bacterium]|jgi:flagellar protein FlaG|nr:flagellar protein FlaG [Deferribacteraceae bacterium]
MSNQVLNIPVSEHRVANYPIRSESGSTYYPPPAEKIVYEDSVDSVGIVSNADREATLLRAKARRFNVDEVLDRLVVKIVDPGTDEVIHQIPSEESLALSKKRIEINKLLFG